MEKINFNLFTNQNKTEENKQPNFNGNFNYNGRQLSVAMWVSDKKTKDGKDIPYSVSISEYKKDKTPSDFERINFSVFTNDYKTENDNKPDFRSNFTLEGQPVTFSMWHSDKKTKNGDDIPFSVSITDQQGKSSTGGSKVNQNDDFGENSNFESPF